MRGKVIAQNTIIGQQGVNLVEQVAMAMGFVWYPTGSVEAGVDGFIELRDGTSGRVTNSFIAVQSKAVGSDFANESASSLDYYCNERDLEYWMKGNLPVLLVVSRPKTNEAYWLSVKDYFRDPARRASRKAHFDKQRDRFDASSSTALMALGLPKEAGFYLAPPPKKELLISNLLPVAFLPQRIYLADTEFRSPGDIWREANARGLNLGGEWILRNRRLLSFHDLAQDHWNELCDRGTVEDFSTEQWSNGDDRDRLREFVDLLRRTLREMVYRDLNHDRKREHYFFRPTENLIERTFSYQALQRTTERTVFSPYLGKDKTVSYYRHSAFIDRFYRFDREWHLEITPTYHFTYDGYQTHSRCERLLHGIKRIEGHEAVRGQVIMWAAYLTPRANLFHIEPYPFLGFGHLRAFEVDTGISDSEWEANRGAVKEELAGTDIGQTGVAPDAIQGLLFA